MLLEKSCKDFLYFLEFGESRSRNSINSMRSDLKQFVSYFNEKEELENISDVTPIVIRGFIGYLSKNNVGKRSINRKISTLRSFFKYCFNSNLIEKNPALLVDHTIFESERPEYILKSEIDKLREAIDLSTCNGVRDRLIVELLFSTGITSQELLSLGESLFQIDKREVTVMNGKHSRVVFFSERARYFLVKYLELKKEKYKEKYNRDIVFVNGSATRLSDRSLRRIIERYALRGEIKREISPYMFRHAFGVYMLKGGLSLEHLKELMGHTTIEITKNYQNLIPNKGKEV